MAVITLARQVGSGGQTIAALLAARLDARVIGRRDLAAAATALGMRLPVAFTEFADEQRLAQVNAGTASPLYFSVGEMEFGDALLGAGARAASERPISFLESLAHERRALMLTVSSLVYSLAAADRVILVGAGSQYLLAGIPGVLRVKIVAPPDVRARRMAGAYGLAPDAARRVVRHGDKEQIEYNRAVFDADWDDPLHWDLIVNSDAIGPETACATILTTLTSEGVIPPISAVYAISLAQAGAINHGLTSAEFRGSWLYATPTAEGITIHGDAATEEQATAALNLVSRHCPSGTVRNELKVRGRSFDAASEAR